MAKAKKKPKRTLNIPRRKVDIIKERKKPTRFIMDKETGEMAGRLEKGDSLSKMRKRGELDKIPSKYRLAKSSGRTWAIRMKDDWSPRGYKGDRPMFMEGQNVGRTKANPGSKRTEPDFKNQPNTVFVRSYKRKKGKGKFGKIQKIRVKSYTRKKGKKK